MAKRTRRRNLTNKVAAIQKQVPQTRRVVSTVRGYKESVEEQNVILRDMPIFWGLPMDEVLYAKFFQIFWTKMFPMPWDDFHMTESTYLPDARNDIHESFVTGSDLPYLMMLDSDVIGPSHMVEILISHRLPIVGGWYRNKQVKSTHHPVVYDFVKEDENGILRWRHRENPKTGLEQVDGMGAGCWLMSREVAEALGERPYSMKGGTEDLVLSKKLMDLGIPLHVDWNLNCAHLGVSYV